MELQEVIPSRDESPLLDPDWRFRRARALADMGVRKYNRREDPWVIIASRYCKARNRTSYASLPQLRHKYPQMSRAQEIHDHPTDSARLQIEALILVDTPIEDIALRVGESVATLQAYEQLFFDVRGKLAARDWLLPILRDRMLKECTAVYGGEAAIKYAAYAMGPTVLDHLTSGQPLSDAVLDSLLSVLMANLTRNGVFISMARQPNRYNAHEILQELQGLLEHKQQARQFEATLGSGKGDGIDAFMAAMLKSVQFVLVERTGPRFVDAAASIPPGVMARLQGSLPAVSAATPSNRE